MNDISGEHIQTLEQGNIYFIYRPRVNEQSPSGPDDIQQLYLVLKPKGKPKYRLAILGGKELPKPEKSGKRQYWGYIDSVAGKPKDIEEQFDVQWYETKTRGERERPEGRPVGEGVYRIVRHEDHTHLVYALELPDKPGKAQRDLNIEPEGSYIVSIKNPEKPTPQNVGLQNRKQADYPKDLQSKFEDRRFYDADPPDFFDYEGTEFVLISSADEASKELGLEFKTQDEDEATADIFKDLRMEKSEHPTEPLFEGKWA